MLFSTNTIILTVGDKLTSLTHVKKNAVINHIFSHWKSEKDLELFRNIIEKNPRASITIMLDTANQVFQEQIITARTKSDFKNELNKQINSKITTGNYVGSIFKKKSHENDFQKNYVFITVENSELVNFWVSFALSFNNSFRGIFSLPAEEQIFIKHTIVPNFIPFEFERSKNTYSNWQMLIFHNKVSGYRIVVLKDKIVVYTEIFDLDEKLLPEKIVKEVEKRTTSLRINLKLMPNDHLDIIVIVSEIIKKAFLSTKFKASNLVIVTPEEVAHKAGIRMIADNSEGYLDEILISSLIKRKLLYPLKQKEVARILNLENIINGYTKCLILVPIALILFAALVLKNNFLVEKIADLDSELKLQIQATSEAKKDLKLIANDEVIKEFIPLSHEISSYNITPITIIANLKKITKHKIIVNSIIWNKADIDNPQREFNNKATIFLNYYGLGDDSKLFDDLIDFKAKFNQIYSNYIIEYLTDIESENEFDQGNLPMKITLKGPIE